MNRLLLLTFFIAILSLPYAVSAQLRSAETIADSLSKAQNYKSAIENYSKAIGASKKDLQKLSDLYAKRGQCKYELELYNEAIADETTAIKYNLQNSDAYWNRGLAYEEINSHALAVKDYTAAMPFFKNDTHNLSKLYDNRAFMNYKQKLYKDALADDSVAIKLNVKNESAYWHVGQVYNKLGYYQLSITNYKTALLYEDDKKEMAKLLDNIANNETSLKQFSKAIDDETTAISLNPDNGGYYWNRGLAYQNNKDYQLAIEDFNKAMQYNLNDKNQLAILYTNRALNELNLKDFQKAIADDSIAITLNPKSGFAHWVMGNAYASLGNYPKAIEKYKNAMDYYQSSKAIMGYLYSSCANCEYCIKDNQASLAHCTLATTLNTQSYSAYFTRGKLFLKRFHDNDGAMKDFKKVLELDTTKKSVDYIFAMYYTGSIDNAMQCMKNRILNTTNDSDILSDYYNMACLLSLMDKKEEANTYLKVAVDKGYPKTFALTDDDLDNIRNTADFKNLMDNK